VEAYFSRASVTDGAFLLAVSALHGRLAAPLADRELECEIPVIVSNHRDVEGLAAFLWDSI